MKKLLVVLLTLSLVVGMFSFAAFADQGNNSGNGNANSTANRSANNEKDKNNEDNQGSGSAVHVVPSMNFNANAINALLNKDAALDRSTGNTEDNSDKVWGSYLKVFKDSPKNKKDPQISSTLSFSILKALRITANGNWDTINGLNKDIKKAFDKFRASLKGLTKVAADATMDAMKVKLNGSPLLRPEIVNAHDVIKRLRILKDEQWKLFRAAVKADKPVGEINALLVTITGTKLSIIDELGLKEKIIAQQNRIIDAKKLILGALKEGILINTPVKTPAVPTFSPKAGAVLTGTSITIKSPGAVVFYTTTPSGIGFPPFEFTTKSGIEFTKKFALTAPTTTVWAIAYKNGVESAIGTAVYFAQEYATAPLSYTITIGAITATLVGPAAGATTKSAITGIGVNNTFSFKVVDAATIPTPATAYSTITINGKLYENGKPYPIRDSHSKHDPYHHVEIVVTTMQDKAITAVRTFIIEFKK